MWRARTRRLQQPPFRPSAGVPPTSPRWQTRVSTVWCCCFPTETVKCVHRLQISECLPSSVRYGAATACICEILLHCRCRDCSGWECGGDQEVASDSAHPAQWDHQTHGQALRQHHCTFHRCITRTVDPFVFYQHESLDRNKWIGVMCQCQFSLICHPNLQVSMARASILWLMGEYCERVPKIAPDVLRKMAKTFTAEEDIVKLQTVNLAAKLYLTNSKQVQH